MEEVRRWKRVHTSRQSRLQVKVTNEQYPYQNLISKVAVELESVNREIRTHGINEYTRYWANLYRDAFFLADINEFWVLH